MKRHFFWIILCGCLFLSHRVLALPQPAAWWQMDEAGGEIAYDASGYDYDASLKNMDPAECWSFGMSGTALWFDGINDYAEAAGYTGIVGGGDRTICAWIRAYGSGVILSYGARTDGVGRKWAMTINAQGTFLVSVWGGTVHGSTNILDGRWHHVAAVLGDVDANGFKQVKDIRLYVDGRMETLSYTENPDIIIDTVSEEPVHLGALDGYGDGGIIGYLPGVLDDVRMYEAVLSGSEINEVIRESFPIHDNEAAAWWPLDEGEGNVAYDSSGNDHQGTLHGNPVWVTEGGQTALHFDRIDDYAEIPGYTGIPGDSDRTLCAWIRGPAGGGIVGYGAQAEGIGAKWIVGIDSHFYLTVSVWGGNVYGSTMLTDGLWHHVAVVLEDVDQNGLKQVRDIRLYVDGQSEMLGYSENPDAVIDTKAEEPVHLGAWDGYGTVGLVGFFSGTVRDVRMYETALSALEIQEIIEGPLELPGSGTPEDPYRITTPAQLVAMGTRSSMMNQCFLLMNDIDLGEYLFHTAVIAPDNSADEGYQGTAFTGTFDGGGHVIRSLRITDYTPSGDVRPINPTQPVSGEYRGLFGFVRCDYADLNKPGIIRNLSVEDYSIEGGSYTGGLAGYVIRCEISNCITRGMLLSRGQADQQSQNDLHIGGLVGRLQRSLVRDCHTGGSIHRAAPCSQVGGLIGSTWEAESQPEPPVIIEFCSADVAIDLFARGSQIGGLIGSNEYGGIYDCTADGDILFFLSEGTLLQGESPCGGLVGINIGGPIHRCHAAGNIKGGMYLGPAGGLIGTNLSVSTGILNCSASGDIKALRYGRNLGGLIGLNQRGTVFQSFAAGDVFGGAYAANLGGLVGSALYEDRIENCYSNGDVAAGLPYEGSIGGLIGYKTDAVVQYCYSSGDLKVNVQRQSVGGLLGNVSNESSILSCFWDTQVQTYGVTLDSGWSDLDEVYGLSTVLLRIKKTYTDADWWFRDDPRPRDNRQHMPEGVWIIEAGKDYPRLWWQQTNRPPIADAGADQTVYAGVDEAVQVQLDGSGSSDPDKDAISWKWIWEIDGQTHEDSTIDPLITLPVGQHVITLVVNDGDVDSQPDEVVITVIEPLKAEMMFVPQILTSKSPGRYVMAVLTLPAGMSVSDLDESEPWRLLPGQWEALRFWTADYAGRQKVFVIFDKDQLIDGYDLSATFTEVEVVVYSKLLSGRTIFGTDMIRVKK